MSKNNKELWLFRGNSIVYYTYNKVYLVDIEKDQISSDPGVSFKFYGFQLENYGKNNWLKIDSKLAKLLYE